MPTISIMHSDTATGTRKGAPYLPFGERMPPGYSSTPTRQTSYINRAGYRVILDTNPFSHTYRWPRPEHIVVAERLLGQNLPLGAVVHHRNRNKLDNSVCNLIILESDAAHKLIHRLDRALEACGHSDWVQCRICKGWDEQRVMWEKWGGFIHPHCRYSRNKRKKGNLCGLE